MVGKGTESQANADGSNSDVADDFEFYNLLSGAQGSGCGQRHDQIDLWRRHPLPHGSWAGLASPAVRGEEDSTNLRSQGWCDGVKDCDGGWGRQLGHRRWRRGRRRRRGWENWAA
jgi:hypothetical protein